MDRITLINQIPINVVFDNKLGRIEPRALSVNQPIREVRHRFEVKVLDKPVIENLTAHDMPPDPPAILVALLSQPMVA